MFYNSKKVDGLYGKVHFIGNSIERRPFTYEVYIKKWSIKQVKQGCDGGEGITHFLNIVFCKLVKLLKL